MREGTAAASLQAEYGEYAMDLASRLSALPEAAMRTAALAEAFRRMGPVRAVWTLEAVIRGALRKDGKCVDVYNALVDPVPVMASVGDRQLGAMLRAGRDQGCPAAIQWLLSESVGEASSEGLDADRLVDKELRQLTLGDRRALARRAKGEMINRLAADPDPGVITNLLQNARVTEVTVLSIASRRPTVSAALEAVLASPRWERRHRVQVALVKNPYLARRRAVHLLVYLTHAELRQVRDDDSLSSELRLSAQRLLDIPLG
ncbi:MAG: hypothetical protein V3T05_11870 [Myxococcota bacterium]